MADPQGQMIDLPIQSNFTRGTFFDRIYNFLLGSPQRGCRYCCTNGGCWISYTRYIFGLSMADDEDEYRTREKDLENEYGSLENEYRTQEEECKTLEDEYRTLEDEYETLEDEYRILENEYVTLEDEYGILEDEYRTREEEPEDEYGSPENKYRPIDDGIWQTYELETGSNSKWIWRYAELSEIEYASAGSLYRLIQSVI
uniref:Uncharacterized protein n=1 Tax=Oryza punctata TaxID=4537 RepID=A0A0E0L9C3_ORYPU